LNIWSSSAPEIEEDQIPTLTQQQQQQQQYQAQRLAMRLGCSTGSIAHLQWPAAAAAYPSATVAQDTIA
jgi:hypothetical protein